MTLLVDNIATAIVAEYFTVESEGTDGFFLFKTARSTKTTVLIVARRTPGPTNAVEDIHGGYVYVEIGGRNGVRDNAAEILSVINAAIADGSITMLTSAELHPDQPSSGDFAVREDGDYALVDVIVYPERRSDSILENADTSSRTRIADLVLTDADGGNAGTLVLAGEHAEKFEIIGNVLYIKAGASFYYATSPTLNVRVQLAEDPSVGVDVTVSVIDIIGHDAIFEITSNNDINAAVAGDVLTVVEETPDPDGDHGRFTYLWYRDGAGDVISRGTTYTIREADAGHSLVATVNYRELTGEVKIIRTPSVEVAAPDGIATAITLGAGAITSLSEDIYTTYQTKIADLVFTDPDGGSPGRLEIVGTHARMFEVIDSVLYLKADASLDHEFASPNTLIARVQLADDNMVGIDVSVAVITDGALSFDATTTILVDEGAPADTVIHTVSEAVSDIADAVITYQLVKAGNHASFIFDSATRELRIPSSTSFNHETQPSFALGILATITTEIDGNPVTISRQQVIIIELNDLNDEAPTITSNATGDALTEGTTVANTQVIYTAAGMFDVTNILWSLSGSDAGLFDIDDTMGDVTFKGETIPDHEDKGSYSFTIIATSGDLPPVTKDVTISVTDTNDEAPTITSNATGDALTEGMAVANTQVIYTATGTFDVTDILWSLGGSDAGLFDIDETTGDVTFKRETIPGHEGRDGYSFTIIATSGDLPPVTKDVTINVIDINDEAPIFHNVGTVKVSATEGDTSTVIFDAVATPDISGAVVTYEITAGGQYVEIDASGKVRLKTETDRETVERFSVTIQATSGGISAVHRIDVSLLDANDHTPEITTSFIAINAGEGVLTTLTHNNINFTDRDASPENPANIVYTMTQAPAGAILARNGVALTMGQTFSHQDVLNGWVSLTISDRDAFSDPRFIITDGTNANQEEVPLIIVMREVAEIVAAVEAGVGGAVETDVSDANDVNYKSDERSLIIDTGDGNDKITAARGSDYITAGLGDDTINLDVDAGDADSSGQDTVTYNFASGSTFTATDGGDGITGFKRGEDVFLLQTESDDPALATLDGFLSYVGGADKNTSDDDLLIVQPNFEYEPDGHGGHTFLLEGVTFHFQDAGTYAGGRLAQGFVEITFDESLSWEEFLSLIEIDNGDGTRDENFNYGRGIIKDLSVLPDLLGEGSLAYGLSASITFGGAVASVKETPSGTRTKLTEITYLVHSDDDGTLELAETGDHEKFKLDGNVLYLKEGLFIDYESVDTLNVRVQLASDRSVGIQITVPVTDVNDRDPVFISGATGTALPENVLVDFDAPGAIIYSAAAHYDITPIAWSLKQVADYGLFNIDTNTGEVRFKADTTPNYEAKAEYTFSVVAVSGALSAEQQVTIAVTNVDEDDASFVVTSNNNIDAALEGDELTVALDISNPDLDGNGDGAFKYQWRRDNGDGDVVSIAGATNAVYTITDDDEGTTLTVVVSYTDGSGTNEAVTTSGVAVPVDNIATSIAHTIPFIKGGGTDGFFLFGTESQEQVLVRLILRGINNSVVDTVALEDTDTNIVTIGVGYANGVRHRSTHVLDVINTAIEDSTITLLTSAELHPFHRFFADPVMTSTNQGEHRIIVAPRRPSNVIAEDADTSSRMKVADIVLTDTDGGDAGTLVLVGTHVEKFELDGTELYLKAEASLDHESADTLNVRVQLNEDTSIGADVSVSVTNVDEGEASFVARAADNAPNVLVEGNELEVALITSDPDGDGTFSYQWQRDNGSGVVPIADATRETYTITSIDMGATLTVVVRYTDSGDTAEEVTVAFPSMDIVDGREGGSLDTTPGAFDQLFIGSSDNDGTRAAPINTHGGTDIIIGLEGEDHFLLGGFLEDTIYHRFSSSDPDWVNTDGGGSFINYVRSGATDHRVEATDTFIFVDTDASVVSEAEFIANDNIRFYANVVSLAADNGQFGVAGFEIRFVGVVESTITITYSTTSRPLVVDPSDPANAPAADFGLGHLLNNEELAADGHYEITDHTKWGHYFGDNDDAFRVIDDEDLPPIIADIL